MNAICNGSEVGENARLRGFDQYVQGAAQDGQLRGAVVGSADDLVVRVLREEGTRRANEHRWLA